MMKRDVSVVLHVHEFDWLFNFLKECCASNQAEGRGVIDQVYDHLLAYLE